MSGRRKSPRFDSLTDRLRIIKLQQGKERTGRPSPAVFFALGFDFLGHIRIRSFAVVFYKESVPIGRNGKKMGESGLRKSPFLAIVCCGQTLYLCVSGIEQFLTIEISGWIFLPIQSFALIGSMHGYRLSVCPSDSIRDRMSNKIKNGYEAEKRL